MKKKILKIFSHSRDKYKNLYQNLFDKKDIEITVKNFSEFYFHNWEILSLNNNKKFNEKDFDLLWQTISTPFAKAFFLINKDKDIYIIDKKNYEKTFYQNNKLNQSIIQRKNNINSIDDLYFLINLDEFNIVKYEKIIVEKLWLPVVAKEVNWNRGEAVFLINTNEELKNIILKYNKNNEWIMFQKFEKNDWDYRVIFFKNKYVWCMKRKSDNFLNNVSSWWETEKVELNEEIIEKLSKITDFFWLDIVWIDIFIDNKWEYKIIEVNDTPQLFWFSKLFPKEIEKYFKSVFLN